jgi:hypothetical protein
MALFLSSDGNTAPARVRILCVTILDASNFAWFRCRPIAPVFASANVSPLGELDARKFS